MEFIIPAVACMFFLGLVVFIVKSRVEHEPHVRIYWVRIILLGALVFAATSAMTSFGFAVIPTSIVSAAAIGLNTWYEKMYHADHSERTRSVEMPSEQARFKGPSG